MTQEKMHLTVNNEIPKMNTTVAITLPLCILNLNIIYQTVCSQKIIGKPHSHKVKI